MLIPIYSELIEATRSEWKAGHKIYSNKDVRFSRKKTILMLLKTERYGKCPKFILRIWERRN